MSELTSFSKSSQTVVRHIDSIKILSIIKRSNNKIISAFLDCKLLTPEGNIIDSLENLSNKDRLGSSYKENKKIILKFY